MTTASRNVVIMKYELNASSYIIFYANARFDVGYVVYGGDAFYDFYLWNEDNYFVRR